MTQKKDSAAKVDWREILGSGPDGLRELVQQVVQEVLEAEMDDTVGAQKSERTSERLGYRSGYYTRTLVTRVGKLVLRVPQDRQGRFRTEVFERYQRSEKALVCALTEMYIQGVSTRKVKEITEQKLVVTIDKSQRIYLGNDPVNIHQLADKIKKQSKHANDVVYLRADETIPFGAFCTVIDSLRESGIANISIVTQPITDRNRTP